MARINKESAVSWYLFLHNTKRELKESNEIETSGGQDNKHRE
jgi:hypothetical protein